MELEDPCLILLFLKKNESFAKNSHLICCHNFFAKL